MKFNKFIYTVLLAFLASSFSSPVTPDPLKSIFARAPVADCNKHVVVIILKAIKAEKFCTDFLGYTTATVRTTVPNTATGTTTTTAFTTTTTTQTTVVATVTSTVTAAARRRSVDEDAEMDHLKARTNPKPAIPSALKSYASSLVSSACSCIATQPTTTITQTASATQTITQTTTQIITQTATQSATVTATTTVPPPCVSAVQQSSAFVPERPCGLVIDSTFQQVGFADSDPAGCIIICDLNTYGPCNSYIYREENPGFFCYLSQGPTVPTFEQYCSSSEPETFVNFISIGNRRCVGT